MLEVVTMRGAMTIRVCGPERRKVMPLGRWWASDAVNGSARRAPRRRTETPLRACVHHPLVYESTDPALPRVRTRCVRGQGLADLPHLTGHNLPGLALTAGGDDWLHGRSNPIARVARLAKWPDSEPWEPARWTRRMRATNPIWVRPQTFRFPDRSRATSAPTRRRGRQRRTDA